ncbi:MAG TPA: porin [Aquabacterium sp.]|uniref:porin n=1 Tax=Aquabacterium sp. TaxID=1872578 RepID=UPI002E361F60|nr:porin [Aquabacterium sp.]HEX5372500.1 porin [Aquabacterium sp.]
MFSKKIVAGAALMALAAVAQAQVKVYGYLDLGVGSLESAGGDSVTHVGSGGLMTSFLGFSGSEDLGGGLKAEFTLETFIGPDTGDYLSNNAGGFWGRGSNIALSGGFGKVAIGQYDTPLFVAGLAYNPFGSSMLLSPTMRHYYGLSLGVAATDNALTTDTGWVNSLTYETPNLGGFTATLQWSPKESSADGAKDSFTLGAAYNAGPLSLMAVYADHGENATGAYEGEQKVYSLNASYDFGVAKGFFQYTDVDNADTSVDDTLFQIGATIPVSAQGNVMVSYGQLKEDTTDLKNKIFSLGYDHSLSKRTGLYAAFTSERATNKSTGNSFMVGVRHSF